MRILVIDDNEVHRTAAQTQLKEHNLTIIASYEEGERVFSEWGDPIYPDPPYDVVMVDLLMPKDGNGLYAEARKISAQETPIGIFLALLAAQRHTKYVAVFTDSDHHSHPASACFDAFNHKGEDSPVLFMVEGAKMFFCNSRSWIDHFRPDNPAEQMTTEEVYAKQKPSVRVKNWGKLLAHMLAH